MLPTQRRYKRAPITEAVIEIRVQSDGSAESAALKRLAEELKTAFPKQAPMQLVHLGVAAAVSGAAAESQFNQLFSHKQVGFRLSSANDQRVLQLRTDGLAYSHMAPYTDWSTFRAEAKPFWERYRQICSAAKLTRCALRYINRVDIPNEMIELEDYFRFYPNVPDDLPQKNMVSMTLNVQMPQADLECMASINQALVDPPGPGVISVVLDIDVFRLGIERWQDSEVWEFLEKLRLRKNEIFEGCITDRTRELIDK